MEKGVNSELENNVAHFNEQLFTQVRVEVFRPMDKSRDYDIACFLRSTGTPSEFYEFWLTLSPGMGIAPQPPSFFPTTALVSNTQYVRYL